MQIRVAFFARGQVVSKQRTVATDLPVEPGVHNLPHLAIRRGKS